MDGLVRRAVVGIFQLLITLGIALFAPARTFDYPQAWTYLAIFGAAIVAITLYLVKYDRDLLARRMSSGPSAEKRTSQRAIQVVASVAFLSIFLIASVDHRFGWSHVPLPLEAAGDAMTALGLFVVFLAFRENSYTAGTIDVWENQVVVASGPYSAVRHPMYSGALLMLCGTPLALGSYWALTAVAPLTAALVARLIDEERFLSANLAGYTGYRGRVRYRLVPGVW